MGQAYRRFLTPNGSSDREDNVGTVGARPRAKHISRDDAPDIGIPIEQSHQHASLLSSQQPFSLGAVLDPSSLDEKVPSLSPISLTERHPVQDTPVHALGLNKGSDGCVQEGWEDPISSNILSVPLARELLSL